jgi:DNA-binding XRE family transcriptional regulator
MSNRFRVVQEAAQRWSRAWLDLCSELREARIAHGLTQAQVATALGTSRARVGRVELAQTSAVEVFWPRWQPETIRVVIPSSCSTEMPAPPMTHICHSAAECSTFGVA